MTTPTPRRCCLSVPASDPAKIAKARQIAVDEVILDLEDSVAVEAKQEARAGLRAALGEGEWRAGSVAVRVNAPGTPWCHADLIALAELDAQPHSAILPKVSSPADLAFAERLLSGAEAAAARRRPLRLQALIETAAGLQRVAEIAAAGGRLESLVLGYADLGAELGRSRRGAADHDAWLPAQDAVLLAARANGLQAVDGPYFGIRPDAALMAALRRAASLGFDGKWAIHPAQVEPVTAAFTPAPDEVERARAVLDALARREAEDGAAAAALDGEMIDEAMRVGAQRVLARAVAA